MAATNFGKICFLKRLINAAVYQDVPNHFFIPDSEDKFRDNEFIFQHKIYKRMPQGDGDTCSWLRANCPDANPVENLWGILKRRLRKYYPSNLEEMKRVISEMGTSMSLETCRDLIGSLLEWMKKNSKCQRCCNKVLYILMHFFKSVFIMNTFSLNKKNKVFLSIYY